MDPITRAKKRRKFFKKLAPVYDNSAKPVLFGYYYHLRRQVREKIDITSEMLDRARTKTNAEFILTDAHSLPFRNEMFDAAISSFALHEMADPKKVLSEMFRVLKPGGDIVVMDVVQQKRLYLSLIHI